jgi:hypothetical protein
MRCRRLVLATLASLFSGRPEKHRQPALPFGPSRALTDGGVVIWGRRCISPAFPKRPGNSSDGAFDGQHPKMVIS